MDVRQLRQNTAEHHRAVEGSLPLMDQTLDRAQYIGCLQRMYGIVAAWEEHALSVAPVWLRESLTARSRRGMLSQDLAWFGTSPASARATMEQSQDLPHLLGAMYVMEGSTLGGQLIARHLESALQLKTGNGNAYFVGHGDRTGTMWKGFCQILTEKVADRDAESVTRGARTMFTTFGLWMRGTSAPDGS